MTFSEFVDFLRPFDLFKYFQLISILLAVSSVILLILLYFIMYFEKQGIDIDNFSLKTFQKQMQYKKEKRYLSERNDRKNEELSKILSCIKTDLSVNKNGRILSVRTVIIPLNNKPSYFFIGKHRRLNRLLNNPFLSKSKKTALRQDLIGAFRSEGYLLHFFIEGNYEFIIIRPIFYQHNIA